jgi:hypothetical protein
MAETVVVVVVVEMVGEEKEVVVEMVWEGDMEDASCEEDGSYEEIRMMILGRQRMANVRGRRRRRLGQCN